MGVYSFQKYEFWGGGGVENINGVSPNISFQEQIVQIKPYDLDFPHSTVPYFLRQETQERDHRKLSTSFKRYL
jgi:hypothetical protein